VGAVQLLVLDEAPTNIERITAYKFTSFESTPRSGFVQQSD
jgi:hypothetical protein